MYKRTELGSVEILERRLKLSARIRTLLLLIESDDLQKLDHKIAHPEHFSTLLELGLIIPIQPQSLLQHSDLSSQHVNDNNFIAENSLTHSRHWSAHLDSAVEILNPPQFQSIALVEQPILDQEQSLIKEMSLEPLGFADVRTLMCDTLKQYCGLMAKHLIVAIDNAQTTKDLRTYQKKWLTSLFETRISREKLTVLLKKINYHLQQIDSL